MKNLNLLLSVLFVLLLPQVGEASCEGFLLNGKKIAEKAPGPFLTIHHYWAPQGSSLQYHLDLMAAGEQQARDLAREYDALNGQEGWRKVDEAGIRSPNLADLKGKAVKGFFTSVEKNRSGITNQEFEGKLVDLISGREIDGPDYRFARIERDGITEVIPFTTLTYLLVTDVTFTLVRQLKGPQAYSKLLGIFQRNRGHYHFRGPSLDNEMVIQALGPNTSHYSGEDYLELKFLDHTNPVVGPMSTGWKEAYLRRPWFYDWKQAVKEKLFGEDYIRLEVNEFQAKDGSMLYKISERRLDLGFKGEREDMIQFSMRLSAEGKITSIEGTGNNLAYRAEELKFGGTQPEKFLRSPN